MNAFAYTLRRMVRELAGDGFEGSAAELTRAALGAFWLRSHYLVEYRTRTLLRAFDTRHQVLAEPVRQMVFGTNYTRPAVGEPLPPYAPAEWNRLIDLCKREVRRLGEEHRAMIMLAESGQDPAIGGWSEANQATLLSYTKGRTAEESLVLSPRASRLLEHSALLRRHVPAELAEHVWLVTRQGRPARAAFEE
ncbi:hypothetical protein [Streptomyces niphimycinicus]|uniref:hypothetical protein n=1 Tax=Streptomyces niphimycinicus TaxID=2842201 RepID=UPI00209AEF8B|nr:hypothetical protein [Streptomyces niphimycinicus]